MALDFGLLYEVTAPYQDREATRAVFSNLVDQARVAEEVGFHSVWHVEHHFLEDLSQSSCNDVILGAYAAATTRMRIGYGVKLLPFNYNHPIKAAEAVATLDQMSGGRVEFGTGRSFTRYELEGFGIDPDETRHQWRESLDVILNAWKDGEFSWDTPTFKFPPRHVLPKPVQAPHPPLWMAGTGPDSHVMAGEAGVGMLSFSIFVPLDELGRRIGLYKEALKRCTNPIGEFVNDRAAAFTMIYCGESDDEARESAGKAAVEYIKTALVIVWDTFKWLEGKDSNTYDYIKEVAGFDPEMITFEMLDAGDMVIVGSPDTCIEKVKNYRDLGVDVILGNFQGPGLSPDKVTASIRRFGEEVIPAFQ